MHNARKTKLHALEISSGAERFVSIASYVRRSRRIFPNHMERSRIVAFIAKTSIKVEAHRRYRQFQTDKRRELNIPSE